MEAWGVPQGEGRSPFDEEAGDDSPGESWVLPLRAPKPAGNPGPVTQPTTATEPVQPYHRSLDPRPVDLSLRIHGLPSDDPLSSLTGRIKGTLIVHLNRLGGQGARGSSGTANGADARDALRQALAAADLYYVAGESYSGFSSSKGSSLLPSTRWARGGGARHGIVTIRRTKGTSLLLVTRDAGGGRTASHTRAPAPDSGAPPRPALEAAVEAGEAEGLRAREPGPTDR